MRYRFASLLAALALVTLAVPANAGDEAVSLRWKFKAGEVTYLVQDMEATMEMETEGAPGQKQQMSAHSVFELKTESVDGDGLGVVVLRFLVLDQTMEIPGMTMKMHVARPETGEVEAKLEMSGPGGAAPVRALMEQFLKGMLDVSVRSTLRPTGELVSTKVEGDPFAKLDAGEDPIAQKMIPSLKSFLDPEEMFAQTLTALYLRLPANPVKVGDTWDASTELAAMGMKVQAKGKARLVALDAGDGPSRGVAKIETELKTEVDAAGYGEKLRKMMSGVMPGTEVEAKFTAEPVMTHQKIEFDVTAGRVREVAIPDLTSKLTGTMSIKMGESTHSSTLSATMHGNVTTRFQSERPK